MPAVFPPICRQAMRNVNVSYSIITFLVR